MGWSGNLEKMKITAFEDGNFSKELRQFSVYINPEKYSHAYEICYNDVQAQGSSGGSPDFNRIPSETVEFELVFDGTGVIPTPLPGVIPFTGNGIAEQIQNFKNLVFRYNGNIHSPNYLILRWGKFYFPCRMTALTITYTLFKPDGTPLRARANGKFLKFNNKVTLALEAANSSPDLTHVLTVQAGDTLPLMCAGIYGSSAYYIEIARLNGLTNFRALVPGTQLVFPPLGDARP